MCSSHFSDFLQRDVRRFASVAWRGWLGRFGYFGLTSCLRRWMDVAWLACVGRPSPTYRRGSVIALAQTGLSTGHPSCGQPPRPAAHFPKLSVPADRMDVGPPPSGGRGLVSRRSCPTTSVDHVRLRVPCSWKRAVPAASSRLVRPALDRLPPRVAVGTAPGWADDLRTIRCPRGPVCATDKATERPVASRIDAVPIDNVVSAWPAGHDAAEPRLDTCHWRLRWTRNRCAARSPAPSAPEGTSTPRSPTSGPPCSVSAGFRPAAGHSPCPASSWTPQHLGGSPAQGGQGFVPGGRRFSPGGPDPLTRRQRCERG